MSEPDTRDPWQPIVLTCDGGGIRGYASLLMIRELMIHIGREERSKISKIHNEVHTSSFEPRGHPAEFSRRNTEYGNSHDAEGALEKEYLPCHYFDYMFGTSTGGLIAIMLSRWRMSVKDCLAEYRAVGGDIFGHPRKVSIAGWPQNKHSKKPLIRAVKVLVKRNTPPGAEPEIYEKFPSPEDLCRTAVLATKKGTLIQDENGPRRTPDGIFLFRTYSPPNVGRINLAKPPVNLCVDINQDIWKVCRSATAAPFFFGSQEIGNEEYLDGGFLANNPTEEALKEMDRLHQGQIRILASFGTGKPSPESAFKKRVRGIDFGHSAITHALGLFRIAITRLTDCEKTHERVLERIERDAMDPLKRVEYFRLNPSEGLHKVKLDEWKLQRDDWNGGKCTTLEFLEHYAMEEINKPETQKCIEELALLLVTQRRRRIDNDCSRWERFSCCTHYECIIEGCNVQETLRKHMSEHLKASHEVAPAQVDEFLKRCLRLPGPF